jgi:hypothetical protein
VRSKQNDDEDQKVASVTQPLALEGQACDDTVDIGRTKGVGLVRAHVLQHRASCRDREDRCVIGPLGRCLLPGLPTQGSYACRWLGLRYATRSGRQALSSCESSMSSSLSLSHQRLEDDRLDGLRMWKGYWSVFLLCFVWSSILGTRKVLETWIIVRKARIVIRSQLLDPL